MSYNIEGLKSLSQRVFQSVPTIVIGSGYSAGYGLPTVGQLSQFLINTLNPKSEEESVQWEKFKELSRVNNLEQALQKIGSLNSDLLAQIIKLTWVHVSKADYSAKMAMLRDSRAMPLNRLLEYLFSTSNNTISIVTTNYDLLCEYSIGSFGAYCTTGFLPGLIGLREDNLPTTYLRGGFRGRVVNLWKVHGSIDWFSAEHSIVRTNLTDLQGDFSPQIITPGVEKYQRSLKEPFRTVLSGADQALSSASSFLCIGYGFNDEHIQEKLVERVNRFSRPICILSLELTPATKHFLSTQKTAEYIAIEKSGSGSKVYTLQEPNGIVLSEESIWDLNGFLKWSIGR